MVRLSRLRRWAHPSLLFAALLYGVGAAVDPWLHAGEVTAVAVEADSHDSDPSGSVPGADFHCFICQTLGTTAQPSLSAALPKATIWADLPVRQSWALPSTLAYDRARPRGPPLS